MFKQLAKEPLLHFLFIGALLFAVFGLTREEPPPVASQSRVVVTPADIDRLVAMWQRSWNRLPTPPEVSELVESYVQEEIFYREAMAMGLEKDDPVVRRRMAQKLTFLFEDIAALAEPSDADLQAYLDQHPERFTQPARFTFRHIYFSADKRGDETMKDALSLLAELRGRDGGSDPAQLGDPFMLDYQYTDVADFDVTRTFGAEFSKQLAELATTQWQGPISSAYGVHLVYLQQRVQSAARALAEIRDTVKADYLAQQRQEANRKFYESVRQRYEVVVQESFPATDTVASRGAAPGTNSAVQ
jgi:hypothetical protein